MMSNVYEYKPTNVVMNHISREVKYEKIYLNGTLLTNRSYYTDEVGNITTMSLMKLFERARSVDMENDEEWFWNIWK